MPHPKLGTLHVNGQPVDFGYSIQSGNYIEAYPASVHISTTLGLCPPILCFRFILDGYLGRLAAYLRLMGFDILYRNDYDDAELAQLAPNEQRILLTRDVGLLQRSLVIYGSFVCEVVSHRQLSGITKRFDLCCNAQSLPVAKADIEHHRKPKHICIMMCSPNVANVGKFTGRTHIIYRCNNALSVFCRKAITITACVIELKRQRVHHIPPTAQCHDRYGLCYEASPSV